MILTHGAANTVDPLGGSYFVEAFTRRMIREADEGFARIEAQGGMIAAIENGHFRREIADAAFAYQQAIDSREKLIVGVNAFQQSDSQAVPIMRVDASTESEQVACAGARRSGALHRR